MLVAIVGIVYVSLFIGRIDDLSIDNLQLIKGIDQIFKICNLPTQIICASIRKLDHIIECAKTGTNIATVPYSVMTQIIKHYLTNQELERI